MSSSHKEVVIIDHYDSFTYNLRDLCHKVDPSSKILVIKSDDSELMNACDGIGKYLIFAPGYGRPKDAGLYYEIFQRFYKTHKILGVCLGHQLIWEFFGGRLKYCTVVGHGKSFYVQKTHDSPLFDGLPDNFNVIRYNSLEADSLDLPKELEILALSGEEKAIAAISHKSLPIYGLQFHPESVGSDYGLELMRNFLL